MHRWEATLFEVDVEYGEIKGTAQHWQCALCGEKFIGTHGDKPHSTTNCEEKQKLFEAVQEFKKRIPRAWGNGKKAREVRDVARQ